MLIDAYRASLPATAAHALDTIPRLLDFDGHEESKPFTSYKSAISYFNEEGTVRLSWGGHNPAPLVDVQGAISDPMAKAIREAYPKHSCSRCDVAIDFLGGRPLFETLMGEMREIARSRGATDHLIASPSDPDKGQTYYLGSRNSEAFGRLYEKGKQLREVKDIAADPAWLRWEGQFAPKNRARKLALAQMPFEHMPGTSRMIAEAFRLVTGQTVPFAPRLGERRSSTHKAILHMRSQYGSKFAALYREDGASALKRLLLDIYREAAADNGVGDWEPSIVSPGRSWIKGGEGRG